MMPLIGFHSVIDSPDSVSRVIPPSTTMPTIMPATRQQPMGERARAGAIDRGLLKHDRFLAERKPRANRPRAPVNDIL